MGILGALLNDLSRVDVPTLVIHGDADLITDLGNPSWKDSSVRTTFTLLL
jgi:pimeloyl-ACP methyl ester carboxylesterase